MIIAALILMRFYFKPEATRLHRKKWVLILSILLLLYGIGELAAAHQKHFRFRVPARLEVEKNMLAAGTLPPSDQVYASQDGFQVLVPGGYKRVEMKSGAVSLVAVKEGVSMIVAVLPISDSLDKTASDLKNEFKSRHPTCLFIGQQNKVAGSDDMVVLEHEMIKNNTQVHLTTAMIKRGDKLFQLMLSSKKELYSAQRLEFEKIIQSFVLK
jgi:hypothetical protein